MNRSTHRTGLHPGRRNGRNPSPRTRQRGQSMTEYAVVCGILATLLFITTPVGQLLTTAIHNFYLDLSFFLSLP